MPDINTLPPSVRPLNPRTMSSPDDATFPREGSPAPLSRTASVSLQAAAAMNAGLQHEESRRSSGSSTGRTRQASHIGRRRSTVLMSLQLNDPNTPAPAEMANEGYYPASPHSWTGSPTMPATQDPHHRAPSLGEIHQELEQEQEAQVNRLLQMIRAQQQQLQALQVNSGQIQGAPPTIDDSTPTSERSLSFSHANHLHFQAPISTSTSTSTPRSPSTALRPRSSFDLSRSDARRSRTSSQTASPRLRSTSNSGEAHEWVLGGRDESSYYQAETQMMIRENQMLRQRIRDLERQVSQSHENAAITHEPAIPSHLLQSSSLSEEAAPLVSGHGDGVKDV